MDTSGPAHGGAVGTGQGNTSGSGTATGQSEDLYTLEAEITELQRENARVESQVLRLRSDITAMENQLKQGEKVSQYPSTQSVIDYYRMLIEQAVKFSSTNYVECCWIWAKTDENNHIFKFPFKRLSIVLARVKF